MSSAGYVLIGFGGGFAACLTVALIYVACAGGGARARDIALYQQGAAHLYQRACQFVSVADDPMPATDLLTLLDLDITKDNQ